MRWRLVILFSLVAALGLAFWAYRSAVSEPLVREAEVALAGWPEGEAPVRALLVSDLHVAGPDMPPERIGRIVARINSLRPDLVLIAGDLVSDRRAATRHYPMAEAVAPLAGLRAPLGVYAVLGNHDHWRDADAARAALAAAGVRLIENGAVAAGPLAIGGLDDAYTGRADLSRTLERLAALPGPRILLSHSPDPFPEIPEGVGLMLAGHTHCGQIRLPLVGAVSYMSEHGDRYACGLVREGGRTLIVTAGLGTSILPLRLGAPPDMWLVTLRSGARRRSR